MAFAGPNVEDDFTAYKQGLVDDELGISEKKLQVVKDVKAGWGDWCGPGKMEISQKILKKRNDLLQKIQTEHNTKRSQRKDAAKAAVIISEKRTKSFSKYKVNEIPFPFTSREEYDRSLQLPLGGTVFYFFFSVWDCFTVY
jgi:U3 small nucleolar RNA-associated protein 14